MTTTMKASTRANASHQSFQDSPALQQFVIGKIDAGIAVLISDSVHLIEFPSLLLPAGVGPGSIVNIACTRNLAAERTHARSFWDLQDSIADEFGAREPEPPRLKIRNTTQTSVTLEWDPLDLAAADLVNLSIYRNNQRLTTIPNPKSNTSTKLSGLQLDTDYAFHLVLKTTAGQYSSPVVRTRTHTIDNTTGISVCFGLVEPPQLLADAQNAVRLLGAKADDKIQIDTTHFVATSSAARSNPNGPPGPEYQKATQLSIPVVTPEWLLACSQAKKLVPISAYYLGQTNRAASLSSAQLVSTPPAANQRTLSDSNAAPQALSQVQEEADLVRPPVELEENVEAPPTEQTIAVQADAAAAQETAPSTADVGALATKVDGAPEPVEPVVVKSSEGGGAAAAVDNDGHNDDDDESSTRGVKSSGEEGESQAEATAAAETQEHDEEQEAAVAEEPVVDTVKAEPDPDPESTSPPPTISVTPPVEEAAPEPEPTTAVTESSDAATRQEEEEAAPAADNSEAAAEEVEGSSKPDLEDEVEAGETSLVDIKL